MQAYKPNQCVELADDIYLEEKILSRYLKKPLEVFHLTKSYQFKYERLSFYEIDYKQKDARSDRVLLYPSFWSKFDNHMAELNALSKVQFRDLYAEMRTFNSKLVSGEPSTEARDHFIKQCTQTWKALDAKIKSKKDQIGLFFAQESVYREYRVISEARYNTMNEFNLRDVIHQLFEKQFSLLKSTARSSSETMEKMESKLGGVKQMIDQLVNEKKGEQRIAYKSYVAAIQKLNEKGLEVFQLSRRVRN